MIGIAATFYKRTISNYVLLFCLIALFSCKKDVISIPDSEKTLEEIYFEDYESPKELWTFIDKTGRELFEPQYDNLRDFRANLAIANKKGRWGVINTKNRTIIPFLYKEITPCFEEDFIIKDFENNYFLLNRKNQQISDTLDLEQLRPAGANYLRFKKHGAWGVMDKDLETIIEARYTAMGTFQNEHFIAGLNGKDILINKEGKEIYQGAQLQWIEKNELLNQKAYDFELIRLNGSEVNVVFTEYGDVTHNGDGALMIFERGRYRFYNYHTKLYTTTHYIVTGALGSELWSVYDQGYLGTLNRDKEIVHNPNYNVINPFKQGHAVVGKNDRWGFIDDKGKEIIPLKYHLAWDFNEGLARVFTDEGIAFIDFTGTIALKANRKYLEVKDFKESYARVQKR